MTHWSDLSDADLDQHLTEELQAMADKPRLGPDWARLEFLPEVRSRLARPAALSRPRLAPVYGLIGAFGAVALLGVLLLVLFTRPPDSAAPAGTPPSSTVRSGDFTLTISADKAVYAPGEPMEVVAELVYDGEAEAVQLSGVEHLIAGFGARQLNGPLFMEADWNLPGVCHELRPGEPITRSYAKSAGWSSDDPSAGFYEQWVTDPELWLPAGRWQVDAIADFSIGDCGTAGERVRLEATIELLVEEPTASPSPARTPPSTWASLNARDFAARVRAGELRGQSVPVLGEIVGPALGPEGPCPIGELCRVGQLGGVDPPLELRTRATPTLDVVGAARAEVEGSSWGLWYQLRAPLGVHRFVLRVLDDGTVEYLGYENEEHPWALSSLATVVQPVDAALDEVVLVPGWLIGTATTSCPAGDLDSIADLPGRLCTPHAWIGPDPVRPAPFDPPHGAVQVQSGAYAEFAGANPAAAAPEPVAGLWALARRLEGSGCPDGNVPCWRWNLIAKVIYAEDGPAMPVATPAPTVAPTPRITPTPTDAPSEPVSDSQSVETSVGTFELTLEADQRVYTAGEPIDLWAELRYQGDLERVELSGYALITGASYDQVDGDLRMPSVHPVPCMPLELRRDEPYRQPGGKGLSYSADDPNADFYRDWADDPVLWLPVGTWQISVGSGFTVGAACTGEDLDLSASIVVSVVEPDASAPPGEQSVEIPLHAYVIVTVR